MPEPIASKPSGWIKEPFSFKDWNHERIFGAPSDTLSIEPINRDISGIPIVSQGTSYTCVACSVTWIKQYFEKQDGTENGIAEALEQQYLAKVSNTFPDGATPRQVLDTARKRGICESDEWIKANGNLSVELDLNAAKHQITGFAYLASLSPASVYYALSLNPIMVGVDSYKGSEPHMMVAYDVEEQNGVKGVKTVNWWRSDVQDTGWIPLGDIRFASSILRKKPDRKVTMPVLSVLGSKWSFVSKTKKTAITALAAIISMFGANVSTVQSPKLIDPVPPSAKMDIGSELEQIMAELYSVRNGLTQLFDRVVENEDQRFGAAGVYDVYSSTISESGMSVTDNFVPVSSLEVQDTGVNVVSASTTFPVYLTINPNSSSNRETVECSGIQTSPPRFTTCYRQIAPTCNAASSTVQSITGTSGAFIHSPGQPVIMSNNACFFNRFVDMNTDQSVTGTKTMTSDGGRIDIGDDTTGTTKFIYFQVGQGSEPYFKIRGPQVAGRTTSTFFFSTDGSSDLELNASGTTVGASTTRAVAITEGLINVVASTTRGLDFDSAGDLEIRASSTPSGNGGFLSFVTSANALGRLFWDVVAFLDGTWTWTGENIFSGAVTSTGGLRVSITPSNGLDAANKNYVDTTQNQVTATGTAGMVVVRGNALYSSATGTLFSANASVTSTAYRFVGIASVGAALGGEVTYIRPSGIFTTTTSFQIGRQYYLGNTSGTIQTTPGSVPVRIGLALTSSTLMVTSPSFRATAAGSFTGFDAVSDTITLNWQPTHIKYGCDLGGGDHSEGNFWLLSDKTTQEFSRGTDDDAIPYEMSNLNSCQWEEGTTIYAATTTLTDTGFVFNASVVGGGKTIYYYAERGEEGF